MIKKDFVAKFSNATEETKKRSNELTDLFLKTVEEVLVEEDSLQFVGWGKFSAKITPERLGRNPKTGEEVNIPERRVVRFKAGKKLADNVNQ